MARLLGMSYAEVRALPIDVYAVALEELTKEHAGHEI